MIDIIGLTVRFGGVTPLDNVGFNSSGHVRPDRTERRWQDHFFNVFSGFVAPAARAACSPSASIYSAAQLPPCPLGPAANVQTEQAIEALSVYDNVAMVHEHCSTSGASRRQAGARGDRVRRPRGRSVRQKVGTLGARERRLVEIARAVVGEPKVVLLDEPAAGLLDEETLHLGRMIQRIPEQRGALVILVDHDMSLVSACCSTWRCSTSAS